MKASNILIRDVHPARVYVIKIMRLHNENENPRDYSSRLAVVQVVPNIWIERSTFDVQGSKFEKTVYEFRSLERLTWNFEQMFH